MNGTETPKMQQDVLDYDGMLHLLDRSIENNLQEPNVYQIFEDLERDIEMILAAQLEKASDSRRRSRLSQLYQKQNKGNDDVDAEKIFEGLKNTGAELNRLENVFLIDLESAFNDGLFIVKVWDLSKIIYSILIYIFVKPSKNPQTTSPIMLRSGTLAAVP
jgi:hypothetical protein